MTRRTGGRALLRMTLIAWGAALITVVAGVYAPVLQAHHPCLAQITDGKSHSSESQPLQGDQKSVTEDGISAGKAAAASLSEFVSLRKPDRRVAMLTEEELELMARVISAEARGESYDGQVAVGAVILNRVEHGDFPDSVYEVCYQKGAFCGVTDGQIDIEPSSSCWAAAEAAARGDDPTGGAVYFYNPKTAVSDWIRSRPVVTIIGDHCFCV